MVPVAGRGVATLSMLMELADCSYRIVVRTHDEGLSRAISATPGLILFGGHGVGVVSPGGGKLPEAYTWSIYAKADTEDGARKAVETAIRELDVAVLVSVEPFEFSEKSVLLAFPWVEKRLV